MTQPCYFIMMKWLILIHQIPAKPSYFRAKIWRRLNKIGAVPVKQAVYIMPNSEQNHEDLGWIAGEITESGGEAFLVKGELIEGLKDEQVIELFRKARRNGYEKIHSEARDLKARFSSGDFNKANDLSVKSVLSKLIKSFKSVTDIDFFPPDKKKQLDDYLNDLEVMINSHDDLSAVNTRVHNSKLQKKTWITRKNIYVDRMASAWFIKEFIDSEAIFRFTDNNACQPAVNELRFDMTEAEYTHHGTLCTFEVLVKTFCPDDVGLQQIAKIIHDIDLKDDAFGLPETAGIHTLFDSIVLMSKDDMERIEQAGNILNNLLVIFRDKNN